MQAAHMPGCYFGYLESAQHRQDMCRRLLLITAYRAWLELCPHMFGKKLLKDRCHGARRLFFSQCFGRVSPHCDKRELFPCQLPRLLHANGGEGTEGEPPLCRPSPLSGSVHEVERLFAGHTDTHKKAGQVIVPHLVPLVRRFQPLNASFRQAHVLSPHSRPFQPRSRPADYARVDC